MQPEKGFKTKFKGEGQFNEKSLLQQTFQVVNVQRVRIVS